MTLMAQVLLIGTALISVLAVRFLGWQATPIINQRSYDYYHVVSLSVLGIAALLLAALGWNILGLMGDATSNKLVAIVASLIPFSWATGLIVRFYPHFEKSYLALMLLGLILITATRFLDAPLLSRIVYPVFHSTAGLVVIIVPVLAYTQGLVKHNFLMVSAGGLLISMGGISMAFLSAGKQLLFFSQDVVLSILAPLLFITSVLYFLGLRYGKIHEAA